MSFQAYGVSWDQRMAQEYPVWGRLCARTFGDFVTTPGLTRLEGAEYVIENAPASSYADDAALLAAALRWDIQSTASLQAFFDVMAQHANGKYVIGDPMWQRYAPRLVRRAADGTVSVEALAADAWTTPSEVNAYFAHLEASPNWTADEARLKVAEYYLRMDDTAQSIIQANALLMKYPDASRTNQDIQASQRADGALIAHILRTEEKARLFLIAMHYRYTKDFDACLAAADQYAALYPDRPYGRYVQTIRGLLLERRGELAAARDAYQAALALLERHWPAPTLNNLPIENCVQAVYREIAMRLRSVERRLAQSAK